MIGVRADVYARLSGHAGLAHAVVANQVLLGPMSAAELARAITEPARLAGLRLEPGLVDLVVRDVADEPGALPLLSHALRATWDRRDGRTLTVAGYRASGGVATAIARTADAVVDALSDDQHRLARGVFLRMTELGEGIEDTRRRVAVDDLVPERADPASVDELLQRLADARLVTLDAGAAQVAHEALIREWPRLRQWLDDDRAGMRVHRQLGQAARLWDTGGRGPVAQRFMMFDAHTGRQLWRRRYPFRGPGDSAVRCGFSPTCRAPHQMAVQVLFGRDGALITSAPQGATLVWDARSGRIVRRYPIGGRPALSPDGRTLALALDSWYAGDSNAALGLLDLRTRHLRRLQGNLPGEWIMSLAFTRDGKQIVGPSDGGAHVWDVASGEVVDTYGGGLSGSNTDLAIDRRGVAFVTSGDGTVTAWDTEGARRVGREFPTTDDTMSCPSEVCGVADPRSPIQAVSLADGRTALRDPRSGRFVDNFPARDGTTPAVPAFFPGGRRLATAGSDGTVTIWDVPKRAAVRTLRYLEPVTWVAVSPDGTLLAVQRQSPGAPDAHVEVRSLRTGRTIYTLTSRFGPGGLAFTGDGSVLVTSECCDGGAAVSDWDARSGAPRFRHAVDEHEPAFAISPRGGTLAVGTADGRVLWWDARTGRSLRTPTKVSSDPVFKLAFSPDGRLLAVISPFPGLWDVNTRKRIGSDFPAEGSGWIPTIAFEPNGRLLIFGRTATSEWPTDRPTLQRFACRIAGRDLTTKEWRDLLPNRPYRHVCPG